VPLYTGIFGMDAPHERCPRDYNEHLWTGTGTLPSSEACNAPLNNTCGFVCRDCLDTSGKY